MEITFSRDEVEEILRREADVIVSNYHVGEIRLEVKAVYNLPMSMTVEATLLPYKEPKAEPDTEEDLFQEDEEPVNLDTLKEELESFDPAKNLSDDDSTLGDSYMHEGLK